MTLCFNYFFIMTFTRNIKYFLLILFLGSAVNLYSQVGVYCITEKMGNVQFSQPFDSLFVTDSQGNVSKYSIPHFTQDIAAHDIALMKIINSVVNLGFSKVLCEGWNYPTLAANSKTTSHYIRSMFLSK